MSVRTEACTLYAHTIMCTCTWSTCSSCARVAFCVCVPAVVQKGPLLFVPEGGDCGAAKRAVRGGPLRHQDQSQGRVRHGGGSRQPGRTLLLQPGLPGR